MHRRNIPVGGANGNRQEGEPEGEPEGVQVVNLPPLPGSTAAVHPGESEQDYVNRMMGTVPIPMIMRRSTANPVVNEQFAREAFHAKWHRNTQQHGARRRSYRKKKASYRKNKSHHKCKSHHKRK